MSRDPIAIIGGHDFVPLAERALFWPRHAALIVADLHLEKGSWYAAQGQPLPPYDSQDTLDRLHCLAEKTGARTIWCLGDSFHDVDAARRVSPATAHQLRALTQKYRWIWVAGNHDGLTGGAWGGEVADDLEVDGVIFRHQCCPGEQRPEISGHFHPKIRVKLRSRLVSRPCFAGDGRRLILPAFGSLAGGLDVQDRAISKNFCGGSYQAMVMAGGRLLRFPCRQGA